MNLQNQANPFDLYKKDKDNPKDCPYSDFHFYKSNLLNYYEITISRVLATSFLGTVMYTTPSL